MGLLKLIFICIQANIAGIAMNILRIVSIRINFKISTIAITATITIVTMVMIITITVDIISGIVLGA